MLSQLLRNELEKLETLPESEIQFQTLREALLTNRDIDLVKEPPQNNRIERTGMELLLGFYSDVDVSFELFLPTFITKVSTDIYSPDKLFLIGAKLKHETFRKEIQQEPYLHQEVLFV